MELQTLLAPFRRAVNQFSLIEDGDKIAVGVSGGKDSLTLLALLSAYRRFSPQRFELMAVTIDMGFKEDAYAPIRDYCAQINVDYVVEKTDIAQILFDIRKEPIRAVCAPKCGAARSTEFCPKKASESWRSGTTPTT